MAIQSNVTSVPSREDELEEAIGNPTKEAFLYRGQRGVEVWLSRRAADPIGILPGTSPASLGDRTMLRDHRIEMPYLCGEMANGIATTEMVYQIGRAGMLGFFGAAGLDPERIERSIVELKSRCAEFSWGTNLIHSPHDSQLEEKTVDIYLKHGVERVSASAFMAVRPSVVRFAYKGVRQLPDGSIVRPNHLFAKLSRPEVARQFMSPAPDAMLKKLVEQGQLTAAEAALAARLPVAADITVEADSGGHTDNRPLVALLPAILSVREELMAKFGYTTPLRVGAAGGLGTPAAVNAAFTLGAAYVLTGSINQCARESGLSEEGQKLIAQATIADVMMAPAGDMFEMGVKVQVLKRGILFGVRGAKLYDIYTKYDSLEQIPPATLAQVEKDILQKPVAQVWEETRQYFAKVKPEEVTRANADPKHKMALVFRWYLGLSSRWAIQGIPERRLDYQIWCGPAQGAFNAWVAGTFLEPYSNRTVAQIAFNLMHGAASVARAQQLRAAGVDVPQSAFQYRPREFSLAATGASTYA